jgi:hypothetical protein
MAELPERDAALLLVVVALASAGRARIVPGRRCQEVQATITGLGTKVIESHKITICHADN